MSTFTPIRSLLLNRYLLLQTWVVVCMTILGCTSQQQTPTQEQKQRGQAQQEQSQPAQTRQVENQQAQDQDEEVQMGQEVFNELKAKGEIIESSPLYDQLKPIVDPIAQAAQPRYNHPFKFYLVHETQPNAFATPGGNVYVVDSLLYFVKNKEQLAGTLCHEVSHTIHHDTVELMEKQEKIKKREIGAAVLTGPTRAHILAILLLGKLHSLGYSRDVESRADLTGSDICAQIGSNPWGLVWLFQDFKSTDPNEIPQLLSDHPDDLNRIDALERHFRQRPSVFAKFNPDPKSATPFAVPKNAQEVFLR
jgi:beta-barrel assembly-enhancing protease